MQKACGLAGEITVWVLSAALLLSYSRVRAWRQQLGGGQALQFGATGEQ